MLGRDFLGIELNPEYCLIEEKRLTTVSRLAYLANPCFFPQVLMKKEPERRSHPANVSTVSLLRASQVYPKLFQCIIAFLALSHDIFRAILERCFFHTRQ